MEISALLSAVRIVLQLTITVTKLKASVDYAVMVARVEGGGDGRPTPTIIEIDLVRKIIHDYNHPNGPREPFIAFLSCDHDVKVVTQQLLIGVNTGSLKYDRTFQMHAAPPRDPGHLQERGQDVQNLQQRRTLQVGAV